MNIHKRRRDRARRRRMAQRLRARRTFDWLVGIEVDLGDDDANDIFCILEGVPGQQIVIDGVNPLRAHIHYLKG